MLLKAGFVLLRAKGSHRIYEKNRRKVVVPFHSGVTLHPRVLKQVVEAVEDASTTP